MTALTWDKPGERIFQTGVDRGVLYLHDGTVVVWNGLTSVEEDSEMEVKSSYLDGVKYLETLIPGDFVGKLKAFTYPDEFESVCGVGHVSFDSAAPPGAPPGPPSPPEVIEVSNSGALGLDFYNQPPKSFNLSYRTIIGDGIDGTEHGYKIHILYNIFAEPDSYSFNTIKGSGAEPIEFGWSLSGTPPTPRIKGFRPTLHISIDSTKTPPEILRILEDMLYGTKDSEPHLPTIQEVAELYGYLGALIILDHGNGIWSAIDESGTFITMIDSTTFQIDNADATYLDADTYTISSTNVELGS
jgi:hypothetical protein